MHRQICVFIAIAAFVLGLAPIRAEASRAWSQALADVDQQTKAEADKIKGPSFSVAVVSRGHPTFFVTYGYADIARTRKADSHTIYEIGSITKLFTATMLMQLRDAGKVSLDDRLSKYLPKFRMPSRFSGVAQPTLRQLASHTSGLPRSLPVYSELEAPGGDEAHWLAAVNDAEASLPPFMQFKYSNLGFGLLGYALARTAALPWPDYIGAKILSPLGMAETYTARGKLPTTRVAAVGYVPGASDGWQAAAKPMTMNQLNEGAGALLSDSTDMAKFLAWQLGSSDNGVLSATSRREMRVPLWVNDDWKSGNGVAFMLMRQGDETLAGHGGGTNGFNSMLVFSDRHGVGVVVLSNGMTNAQGLAMRLMIPLIAAAKAETADNGRNLETPAPDTGAFAGLYEHDYGLVPPITVVTEGSRLVMHDDNWGTVRLRPTDRPGTFTASGNATLEGEAITFDNREGVMRLAIGHGSVVYLRQKR